MRACVLGPLSIKVESAVHSPTSNREKQLLALFLLNLPHVTSIDMIIDELWHGAPPKSAVTTVQTYVFHLRHFLAVVTGLSPQCVAGELLVHRSRSYTFLAESVELDLQRLREDERLVYIERERRNYAAVVEKCEMALQRWEGQTLSDIRPGQRLQAEIDGIERTRLSLTEERIESELLLGRSRKVLADLSRLTAMHPLHEGLHYNYMKALAQSGYRARSLEVYRSLRTGLVEELGLEPASELQRLHAAILNEAEVTILASRRRDAS